MDLISLLKENRLTLGEVELLENILDKNQEILWSERPRRPIKLLLGFFLTIWALVSAGHVWMGQQNGESLLAGIAISAIVLAIVIVSLWIMLSLNSLKPNIVVTANEVILTVARLRQPTSEEVALVSAIAQTSPIIRTAFRAQLTSESVVRVTKSGALGSLTIETTDAGNKSTSSRSFKLLHVPDPENLRQIISKSITDHKHLQEGLAS